MGAPSFPITTPEAWNFACHFACHFACLFTVLYHDRVSPLALNLWPLSSESSSSFAFFLKLEPKSFYDLPTGPCVMWLFIILYLHFLVLSVCLQLPWPPGFPGALWPGGFELSAFDCVDISLCIFLALWGNTSSLVLSPCVIYSHLISQTSTPFLDFQILLTSFY